MAIQVSTSNVALTFILAFAIVFFLALLSRPAPAADRLQRLEQVPQGPSAPHFQTLIRQQANRVDTTLVNDAQAQQRMDAESQPPRVKVAAYIEMMCPDCARFVVHDLGPQRFPDEVWRIVDLRFVPWVRKLPACKGQRDCMRGPTVASPPRHGRALYTGS